MDRDARTMVQEHRTQWAVEGDMSWGVRQRSSWTRPAKGLAAHNCYLVLVPEYLGEEKRHHSGSEREQEPVLPQELEWYVRCRFDRKGRHQLESRSPLDQSDVVD